MRVRIIWFVFGAIVTLWVNAYTDELDAALAADWMVGPSVDMLGPTDDDEEVIEEEVPDANWLRATTPRFTPA